MTKNDELVISKLNEIRTSMHKKFYEIDKRFDRTFTYLEEIEIALNGDADRKPQMLI